MHARYKQQLLTSRGAETPRYKPRTPSLAKVWEAIPQTLRVAPLPVCIRTLIKSRGCPTRTTQMPPIPPDRKLFKADSCFFFGAVTTGSGIVKEALFFGGNAASGCRSCVSILVAMVKKMICVCVFVSNSISTGRHEVLLSLDCVVLCGVLS